MLNQQRQIQPQYIQDPRNFPQQQNQMQFYQQTQKNPNEMNEQYQQSFMQGNYSMRDQFPQQNIPNMNHQNFHPLYPAMQNPMRQHQIQPQMYNMPQMQNPQQFNRGMMRFRPPPQAYQQPQQRKAGHAFNINPQSIYYPSVPDPILSQQMYNARYQQQQYPQYDNDYMQQQQYNDMVRQRAPQSNMTAEDEMRRHEKVNRGASQLAAQFGMSFEKSDKYQNPYEDKQSAVQASHEYGFNIQLPGNRGNYEGSGIRYSSPLQQSTVQTSNVESTSGAQAAAKYGFSYQRQGQKEPIPAPQQPEFSSMPIGSAAQQAGVKFNISVQLKDQPQQQMRSFPDNSNAIKAGQKVGLSVELPKSRASQNAYGQSNFNASTNLKQSYANEEQYIPTNYRNPQQPVLLKTGNLSVNLKNTGGLKISKPSQQVQDQYQYDMNQMPDYQNYDFDIQSPRDQIRDNYRMPVVYQNQIPEYARVEQVPPQYQREIRRRSRDPSFDDSYERRSRSRHSSSKRKHSKNNVNPVEVLLYDYAYIFPDAFVRHFPDLVSYDYVYDMLDEIPRSLQNDATDIYLEDKMAPISKSFIDQVKAHLKNNNVPMPDDPIPQNIQPPDYNPLIVDTQQMALQPAPRKKRSHRNTDEDGHSSRHRRHSSIHNEIIIKDKRSEPLIVGKLSRIVRDKYSYSSTSSEEEDTRRNNSRRSRRRRDSSSSRLRRHSSSRMSDLYSDEYRSKRRSRRRNGRTTSYDDGEYSLQQDSNRQQNIVSTSGSEDFYPRHNRNQSYDDNQYEEDSKFIMENTQKPSQLTVTKKQPIVHKEQPKWEPKPIPVQQTENTNQPIKPEQIQQSPIIQVQPSTVSAPNNKQKQTKPKELIPIPKLSQPTQIIKPKIPEEEVEKRVEKELEKKIQEVANQPDVEDHNVITFEEKTPEVTRKRRIQPSQPQVELNNSDLNEHTVADNTIENSKEAEENNSIEKSQINEVEEESIIQKTKHRREVKKQPPLSDNTNNIDPEVEAEKEYLAQQEKLQKEQQKIDSNNNTIMQNDSVNQTINEIIDDPEVQAEKEYLAQQEKLQKEEQVLAPDSIQTEKYIQQPNEIDDPELKAEMELKAKQEAPQKPKRKIKKQPPPPSSTTSQEDLEQIKEIQNEEQIKPSDGPEIQAEIPKYQNQAPPEESFNNNQDNIDYQNDPGNQNNAEPVQEGNNENEANVGETRRRKKKKSKRSKHHHNEELDEQQEDYANENDQKYVEGGNQENHEQQPEYVADQQIDEQYYADGAYNDGQNQFYDDGTAYYDQQPQYDENGELIQEPEILFDEERQLRYMYTEYNESYGRMYYDDDGNPIEFIPEEPQQNEQVEMNQEDPNLEQNNEYPDIDAEQTDIPVKPKKVKVKKRSRATEQIENEDTINENQEQTEEQDNDEEIRKHKKKKVKKHRKDEPNDVISSVEVVEDKETELQYDDKTHEKENQETIVHETEIRQDENQETNVNEKETHKEENQEIHDNEKDTHEEEIHEEKDVNQTEGEKEPITELEPPEASQEPETPKIEQQEEKHEQQEPEQQTEETSQAAPKAKVKKGVPQKQKPKQKKKESLPPLPEPEQQDNAVFVPTFYSSLKGVNDQPLPIPAEVFTDFADNYNDPILNMDEISNWDDITSTYELVPVNEEFVLKGGQTLKIDAIDDNFTQSQSQGLYLPTELNEDGIPKTTKRPRRNSIDSGALAKMLENFDKEVSKWNKQRKQLKQEHDKNQSKSKKKRKAANMKKKQQPIITAQWAQEQKRLKDQRKKELEEEERQKRSLYNIKIDEYEEEEEENTTKIDTRSALHILMQEEEEEEEMAFDQSNNDTTEETHVSKEEEPEKEVVEEKPIQVPQQEEVVEDEDDGFPSIWKEAEENDNKQTSSQQSLPKRAPARAPIRQTVPDKEDEMKKKKEEQERRKKEAEEKKRLEEEQKMKKEQEEIERRKQEEIKLLKEEEEKKRKEQEEIEKKKLEEANQQQQPSQPSEKELRKEEKRMKKKAEKEKESSKKKTPASFYPLPPLKPESEEEEEDPDEVILRTPYKPYNKELFIDPELYELADEEMKEELEKQAVELAKFFSEKKQKQYKKAQANHNKKHPESPIEVQEQKVESMEEKNEKQQEQEQNDNNVEHQDEKIKSEMESANTTENEEKQTKNIVENDLKDENMAQSEIAVNENQLQVENIVNEGENVQTNVIEDSKAQVENQQLNENIKESIPEENNQTQEELNNEKQTLEEVHQENNQQIQENIQKDTPEMQSQNENQLNNLEEAQQPNEEINQHDEDNKVERVEEETHQPDEEENIQQSVEIHQTQEDHQNDVESQENHNVIPVEEVKQTTGIIKYDIIDQPPQNMINDENNVEEPSPEHESRKRIVKKKKKVKKRVQQSQEPTEQEFFNDEAANDYNDQPEYYHNQEQQSALPENTKDNLQILEHRIPLNEIEFTEEEKEYYRYMTDEQDNPQREVEEYIEDDGIFYDFDFPVNRNAYGDLWDAYPELFAQMFPNEYEHEINQFCDVAKNPQLIQIAMDVNLEDQFVPVTEKMMKQVNTILSKKEHAEKAHSEREQKAKKEEVERALREAQKKEQEEKERREREENERKEMEKKKVEEEKKAKEDAKKNVISFMSFETSSSDLSEGVYRMYEEREKKKEEQREYFIKEARNEVDVQMPEMIRAEAKELKWEKTKTIPKPKDDLDYKKIANEILKNEENDVSIRFEDNGKSFILSRDKQRLFEIPPGFEDIPDDALLDMLEDDSIYPEDIDAQMMDENDLSSQQDFSHFSIDNEDILADYDIPSAPLPQNSQTNKVPSPSKPKQITLPPSPQQKVTKNIILPDEPVPVNEEQRKKVKPIIITEVVPDSKSSNRTAQTQNK